MIKINFIFDWRVKLKRKINLTIFFLKINIKNNIKNQNSSVGWSGQLARSTTILHGPLNTLQAQKIEQAPREKQTYTEKVKLRTIEGDKPPRAAGVRPSSVKTNFFD
jgi:hypothetical protein